MTSDAWDVSTSLVGAPVPQAGMITDKDCDGNISGKPDGINVVVNHNKTSHLEVVPMFSETLRLTSNNLPLFAPQANFLAKEKKREWHDLKKECSHMKQITHASVFLRKSDGESESNERIERPKLNLRLMRQAGE